jgi:hypothetical protein
VLGLRGSMPDAPRSGGDVRQGVLLLRVAKGWWHQSDLGREVG